MDMLWDKILLCACALLLMEGINANTYDMEKCDFAGFLDVPEGAPVVVNGGTLINTVIPNPCSIVFRATNPEHTLTIDLTVLNLIDCSITLNFIYSGEVKTFRCGTKNPGEIYTNARELTVNFLRGIPFSSYKFQFLLTSSKPLPVLPGDSANPGEVGLIVGIVAGVFCLLLLAAILAVCCHRRAAKAKVLYRANQVKQPLDQHGKPATSVGFTNNAVQNGYMHESSPRAKTKLLSETEGSSSPSSRPKTLNFHSSTKSEDTRNVQGRGKQSTTSMDYHDDDDTYDKTEDMKRPPKSPFLSALSSNTKFKASSASNNRDADERAKRISSSSSVESSGASRDSPPPLPVVPVSKSPGSKRKNHASIRRAYRTTSSSEEEFNQMANASAQRDDSGPSSNEMASNRDNQKANTKHSLKPDKSKKKGNKKDMKLEDYEPTSGNFQKNTARASKRAQKSPRLGNRSDGFGHRRRRSDGRSDNEDSRPGTPTSMCDLESLPPLTRSSSRQSLYASRSSLYRRRGRKGSYSESVASTYIRDDMEIGRHSRSYSQDYDDDETDGGYERPINRHERERVFRSMGELGRETKERSTQTLRETATQTGSLEQSVIMQPKRVVKKKRRSKSMSAVATQTTKEVKKTEKAEAATGDEKPKPKPKPKPRKSMNSISAVSAVEDSDDGKKKKKKKKRAKSREDLSHADRPVLPQEEQLPAPQVPGQPYLQYNMPQGPHQMVSGGYPGAAPGMPIQPYPAGYPGGTVPYNVNPQTGYMMPPQPGQPIPQPGQPIMHPGQPIMHPGQPIMHTGPQVPPQSAHIPGKPRKSNWDTLCAITDDDHQRKQAAMTETGSMASSVFTYNHPSHVGHPGIPVVHPQQPGVINQAYSNVAYPAATAAVPQTETMPRVPPSYMDAINMDAMSGPPSWGTHSNGHQSGSPSQSGSDTGLPVIVHNDTTNLLPKKSSWEVLKEITDNQKNESVV